MLNVGTPDRIVRLLAAAILIALPFFNLPLFANPVLWWGAIVVGAVLAVTAVIGFCPLYAAFGIRTRRRS